MARSTASPSKIQAAKSSKAKPKSNASKPKPKAPSASKSKSTPSQDNTTPPPRRKGKSTTEEKYQHFATIVNAILMPPPHTPWIWHTFQALTGLTSEGFLDPDFRYPQGKVQMPLSQAQSEAVSSYLSVVANDSQKLRAANVNIIPNYTTYSKIATPYFNQPNNLVPTITALMEELQVTALQNFRINRSKGLGIDPPSVTATAAQKEIALAVWGIDAWDGVPYPPPPIQQAADAIHYRLYEAQRARVKRQEKNLEKWGTQVRKGMSAWKKTPGSIKRFRDVLKAVEGLQRVQLLLMEEELDDVKEAKQQLNEFVEAGREHFAQASKGTKATAWNTIATEEDINEFQFLWEATFSTGIDPLEEVVAPPVAPEAEDGTTDFYNGALDVGVDEIRHLRKPDLYNILGIPADGHIPFLRNFERRDGKKDEPDIRTMEELKEHAQGLPEAERVTSASLLPGAGRQPEDLLPEERLAAELPQTHVLVRALGHQLQGVLAIFQRWLSPIGSPKPASMLLADEVGVGKTLQVLIVIALVSHYRKLQQSKLPLPPLFTHDLQGRPCRRGFGGLEEIPETDGHVIIAPPGLLSQWNNEIQRFVDPRALDIITYDASKSDADAWWERAMSLSKQVPTNRIIVMPTTLVKREFKLRCHQKNSKYAPAKARSCSFKHILNAKYLVVAVDETHLLRTFGVDAQAVMAVIALAILIIGLSATPLFTTTIDIAHQAIVLHFEGFQSPTGVQAEVIAKKVISMLREGKRKHKGTDNQLIVQAIRNHQKHLEQNLQMANPTFLANVEALAYLRDLTLPLVVRRTQESLDADGKTILMPNPKFIVDSFVELSEFEDGVFDEKAQAITKEANGQSKRLYSRIGFFTDIRRTTLYSAMVPSPNEVKLMTREDWEMDEAMSSKMMRVVDILKYHIGGIDLDSPHNPEKEIRTAMRWNANGDVVPVPSVEDLWKLHNHPEGASGLAPELEALTTGPLVGYKRRSKVVIFLQWTSYLPLLEKVLSLYGFHVSSMTGKTPQRKRNERLQAFASEAFHFANDDTTPSQILILSQIGTTGLNAPRGCILIVLDQLWSGAEMKQLMGRLARQGQIEDVIVYKVLANNTTDIIMNGMALGKDLMLQGYTDRSVNLRKILTGKVDLDDEPVPDEEASENERESEDDTPPSPKKMNRDKPGDKPKEKEADVSASPVQKQKQVVSPRRERMDHVSVPPRITPHRRPVAAPTSKPDNRPPPPPAPLADEELLDRIVVSLMENSKANDPVKDAMKYLRDLSETLAQPPRDYDIQQDLDYTLKSFGADNLARFGLRLPIRDPYVFLDIILKVHYALEKGVDGANDDTDDAFLRSSVIQCLRDVEGRIKKKGKGRARKDEQLISEAIVRLQDSKATLADPGAADQVDWMGKRLKETYGTFIEEHGGDGTQQQQLLTAVSKLLKILNGDEEDGDDEDGEGEAEGDNNIPSASLPPSLPQSSSHPAPSVTTYENYPIPRNSSGGSAVVTQGEIKQIVELLWEHLERHDMPETLKAAQSYSEKFHPDDMKALQAQQFLHSPSTSDSPEFLLFHTLDWIKMRSGHGTTNTHPPWGIVTEDGGMATEGDARDEMAGIGEMEVSSESVDQDLPPESRDHDMDAVAEDANSKRPRPDSTSPTGPRQGASRQGSLPLSGQQEQAPDRVVARSLPPHVRKRSKVEGSTSAFNMGGMSPSLPTMSSSTPARQPTGKVQVTSANVRNMPGLEHLRQSRASGNPSSIQLGFARAGSVASNSSEPKTPSTPSSSQATQRPARETGKRVVKK